MNFRDTEHAASAGEWCENRYCTSCAAWRQYNGIGDPDLTTTTQALADQSEVDRLRQLVKTKDQIIGSLRRQLTGSEEFARELMRLL